MSSKLQGSGLALVAALVIGAVAAGSAQAAEEFHAVKPNPLNTELTGEKIEHVILDSKADDSELHAHQLFTNEAGAQVTCNVFSPEGTLAKATPTEITVTPKYSVCEVSNPKVGSFFAHIELTECHYRVFSAYEGEHAPIAIACKNQGEEIHVFATFLGVKLQCITVPEQEPTAGGVTYTNARIELHDAITVTATVEGIEYTTHQNCGGQAEGYETLNDMTYQGAIIVGGTDTGENRIHLWWE